MVDYDNVERSSNPDTLYDLLDSFNQTAIYEGKETKFRVNGYRVDSLDSILSQVWIWIYRYES